MKFTSPLWYPIAVLVSAANVVAVWFAAVPAGPLHATIHAVLAVGFASWAHRLRQSRDAGRLGPETVAALDALEAAEIENTRLRQELGAAQQRIEFAERVAMREPVPRENQRP
jgi:hypothetical protein